MVYLITYSRADEELVQSRESFARMVVQAWSAVTESSVIQWVVGKEAHENSNENESYWHYHMALRLDKKCRWLQVRSYLQARCNIRVNFSDKHSNYYTAYKYVTKEDASPAHSPSHPDLLDAKPPKTTEASTKRHKKHPTPKRSALKKKKDRLSVFEVVQVIRDKKIKTRTELLAFAEIQRRNCKQNLAEFIANRGCRVVNEAISLAEQFDEAEAAVIRSKKNRVLILQEQLTENCVAGCEKKWLSSALELLHKNGIDVPYYCTAIFNALRFGRGKYRNIYIHGPSNCWKTFMISLLKEIYKAFVNPASGTFAWVGAENPEIIVLNDFRWSPSIIAWSDLLQILEGDTMHLATPKNFSNKDVVFDKDTPFFATADAPIVLVRGGSIDRTNTEMMAVRWRSFSFSYQVKELDRRELKPCGRCFAELVLCNKSCL